MWLTNSSIGRKFVMAITGIALVLFVTFHVLMNAVALLWPTAYNQVCEFLGANWYALIASAGLALLFIIHIIYALWLTVQNRAARGNDRYKVTARQPQVEWASKNMLVLGIVVLAFLAVHLIQFWAKMQLQEMLHHDLTVLPQLDGVPCAPAMGTLFLQMAFQEIWTPVVYIIGFVALWFHMTHGFWSMFHTVGWDNNIWLNRLKTIGCWWASIVVVLFIAQAVTFSVLANKNYYTENPELREQYAEFWSAQSEKLIADFEHGYYGIVANDAVINKQDALISYFQTELPGMIARGEAITDGFSKQCPGIFNENVHNVQGFVQQMKGQLMSLQYMSKTPAAQSQEPMAQEPQAQTPDNN